MPSHQLASSQHLAQIADAITANLSSPAVLDANLEPANVVDALADCSRSMAAIADGLHAIADAIRGEEVPA